MDRTESAPANGRDTRIKIAFQLAVHMPFWALVLLGVLTLGQTDEVQAGDASETMAFLVGFATISFGLTAAAIRASAGYLRDPEDAEDLRMQGRALLLGATALVLAGSSLILLSLAGPGRLVSASTGAWGTISLNILAMVFVSIRYRGLDELNRAVAKDAGYLAFGFVSTIGGIWATLAHLGLVIAPAPLDWVTMLSGFHFISGLVAAARKGSFEQLPQSARTQLE